MPTGPVLNGSGWPLRTVLSCSVGGVRDAVKRAEGVCKNKSSGAIGDTGWLLTTEAALLVGFKGCYLSRSNSRPTQGSVQLLNKKSSDDKGAIVNNIAHVLQRLL